MKRILYISLILLLLIPTFFIGVGFSVFTTSVVPKYFPSKTDKLMFQELKSSIKPVGLNGFYKGINHNKITLQLVNIQNKPVEALYIEYNGQKYRPIKETILMNISVSDLNRYKTVVFHGPKKDSLNKKEENPVIKIAYKTVGDKNIRYNNVLPWTFYDEFFIKDDITNFKPNYNEFAFIEHNKNKATLTIIPGNWTLNKCLIIPSGLKVICKPGTTINLSNQAVILSYSRLDFRGTKSKPIHITSKKRDGKALVVLLANRNKAGKSVLRNVLFSHLSAPQIPAWSISASVMFYESDVAIDSCSFSDNHYGDDFLNIFRSNYSILNSKFRNILADAFDGDFCDGIVENTSFYNIGNDGIDVSGSEINIKNVVMTGIKDKALSAGEKSNMKLDNIELTNVAIGLTSKDYSIITGDKVAMNNTELGFAVFQKKAEFGPASIDIKNFESNNINKLYLLEKKCKLKINGTKYKYSNKNVKTLLYGNEYGKASVR